MAEPLSPAAQVVLNEALYQMCAGESESYATSIAAAIIRAATDQVVPELKPWLRTSDASVAKHDVREQLLAIATELEAQ